MKLLQITCNDLAGGRFNGVLLREHFERLGIDSTHLVWRKASPHPSVIKAFAYPGSRELMSLLSRIESRFSLQAALNFQWFALPAYEKFRSTDVVHYHLLHDGNYFSMAALPWLSFWKPSVWTLHDPWAMTGHCVHPLDCENWKTGCGNCPYLDLPIAIREDRTARNFRMKHWAYRRSRMHIILASRWMMSFASQSPLMKGFHLHHVPFGLDLERFRPRPPDAARRSLGVPKDHTVICLRAFDGPYKGLGYVRQALRLLSLEKKISLLTFNTKGILDEFIGKYPIVELGWTDNENLMIEAYSAADFFLMPSIAEAFGLMAIEAMACGKPVICFEGTSLPEITFAPEVGLAVPSRDAGALASAIARWVRNPDEVAVRGAKARVIAEKHYGVARFVRDVRDVYAQAIEEHQGHRGSR